MKKIVLIVVTVGLVLVGLLAILNQGSNPKQSDDLVPTTEITHGHGLAVDVADPSKLYIATHQGLFVLQNDKDLYRVGNKKDDYMGFTPHPSDPKVFYSSGHPSFGGNLGFQKSEDGGFSWQKVSNGIAGPVDFHALTVSPVNPNLLYGWYRNSLQRSTDGGKNWEVVQSNLSDVVSLTADPKKEDNLYAATSKGLWFSQNKGSDWASASEATKDNLVSAFTIHPTDSQILLSFSQEGRLSQSSDGGKNWEKVTEDFGGELVMYLAYSKQNPEIVYSLTMRNAIYKSNDAGKNWTKIR